jgi:hypothetical protein
MKDGAILYYDGEKIPITAIKELPDNLENYARYMPVG